jgi:hypothetical protein
VISFDVSTDADWLSCTPANGSSSEERVSITVDYSTSSLPPEFYTATITVTDFAAANSAVEIPVTVTISEASPIYRFWSDTNRSHFYTMSETEKYTITVTYPEDVWRYERIAWLAYAPDDAPLQAKPVYRFWSDKNRAHFFTISENEKDSIIATYAEEVWRYERIAYYAYAADEQPDGAKPVYRFWSARNRRHFYTISEEEKNSILANYPEEVWGYEGIAWYAFDAP